MAALAAALLRLHLHNPDVEQIDVVACENGIDVMIYWYGPAREGHLLVQEGAVGVDFHD